MSLQRNNNKLMKLKLDSYLSDDDLKLLLSSNKYYHIGLLVFPSQCKIISDLLKNNRTLRGLDLLYSEIGAEGMKDLVDGLINNNTLTSFSLQQGKLGIFGTSELVKVFNNTTITKIKLKNNSLDTTCIRGLIRALANNSTITKINFSGNKFDAPCIKELEKLLVNNRMLTHLNLSCCQLASNITKKLVNILSNTAITKLNLAYNNLNADDKKALTGIFANDTVTHNTVTQLNLSGNIININDLRELTNTLNNDRVQLKIKLPNIELGAQEIIEIAQIIEQNNVQIIINPHKKYLSEAGINELTKLKLYPKLNFNYVDLKNKPLLTMIEHNRALTSLNLGNIYPDEINRIFDDNINISKMKINCCELDMVSLANILENNNTITKIKMVYDGIKKYDSVDASVSGFKELALILKKNKIITNLSVGAIDHFQKLDGTTELINALNNRFEEEINVYNEIEHFYDFIKKCNKSNAEILLTIENIRQQILNIPDSEFRKKSLKLCDDQLNKINQNNFFKLECMLKEIINK